MGQYKTGMYPGTFDPITNGHFDIIKRALKMVDKLVIGVAINIGKHPLFSLDERVAMVETEMNALRHQTDTEIVVKPFDTLLMSFAEEQEADFIIRGLRAVSDFEYEFQMVGMNSYLNDEIETVFMMADPKHQAIASRLVKEIARLDGKVSDFVSLNVEKQLKAKLRG